MTYENVYELCRLLQKPFPNVEELERIEELRAEWNKKEDEKLFERAVNGLTTVCYRMDLETGEITKDD